MNKLELMTDQQYLFGAIFVAANRMDTLLGREFKKFDITTKQWFLSIIIDNLFDKPPTIKEVAREMGSSHQNVKQVALKLEQKGLLILERDKRDSRAIRLKLSKASFDFWKKLEGEGDNFTQALFKDINKDEIEVARKVMQKMLLNISQLYKKSEEN
ncbi:MarR family winged helix-turn-helix transcriptional regulator [Clostridium pasteurianum]|uniref:Transcriptional regulator n=1 Tax=Clostridium pasteurianum BC1 TaxID=86416 RepID=R4K1L2_CLOPA|nr:MarR family transcriptional regulator [Clostridium pasteurianum]AGK96987.1 transcriptional regulator [Clostridium pasteurianum BC1]